MVKNLLEAGWKMNEILDSPLYYLIEVLQAKNKPGPERKDSLIAAFGG